MTVKQIIEALERFAPLNLQEPYDNSGLQVGFPGTEVTGILVSLDITESIIDEAVSRGCNLVVSHHPLLFHPLKCVSDAAWQQRCVVKALSNKIALYSAHTNLDNARGGVNFKIAERLGLKVTDWLSPVEGRDAGSGLVGELPVAEEAGSFISRVQEIFGVPCLKHTPAAGKSVRKVALCGGAGAFLIGDALKKGVDCFITGEFHYHDFFNGEGMLLMELGHWQSEQFTCNLLENIIKKNFPDAEVKLSGLCTDPVEYSFAPARKD